ncbi:HAMP domain-containing protein, partial [Aurantimonas sp. MSK8Z-1]|uniref:HAMP domain-containing protein n=1 Tax=Mangrovibrevibacter kandeliae TaxID=2968473 RepID=UPI00222FC763
MRTSDLSIAKKIGLAFGILIIGAALMGLFVRSSLGEIDAARDNINRHTHIAAQSTETRFIVSRMEAALRAFMITQNERYTKAIASRDATLADKFATMKATYPELSGDVDAIAAALAGWKATVVEPIVRLASNEATTTDALTLFTSETADKSIEALENAIDKITTAENASIESGWNGSAAAADDVRMALMVGIGVLVLLSIGLGWVLTRGIAGPVRALTSVMLKLAGGDKAVLVAGADRKDELGAMAGAVETFKQAAIRQDRLEAEAKAVREAQVAERERQMAAEQAKAEELKGFVHDIEAGFERLAEGDLTVRMERPVAEEFEPIRAQFNQS